MPLYDFICPKCGAQHYNKLQSVDDPKPECPKCGTTMNVDYRDFKYGIQKKGDGWTPKFHK